MAFLLQFPAMRNCAALVRRYAWFFPPWFENARVLTRTLAPRRGRVRAAGVDAPTPRGSLRGALPGRLPEPSWARPDLQLACESTAGSLVRAGAQPARLSRCASGGGARGGLGHGADSAALPLSGKRLCERAFVVVDVTDGELASAGPAKGRPTRSPARLRTRGERGGRGPAARLCSALLGSASRAPRRAFDLGRGTRFDRSAGALGGFRRVPRRPVEFLGGLLGGFCAPCSRRGGVGTSLGRRDCVAQVRRQADLELAPVGMERRGGLGAAQADGAECRLGRRSRGKQGFRKPGRGTRGGGWVSSLGLRRRRGWSRAGCFPLSAGGRVRSTRLV